MFVYTFIEILGMQTGLTLLLMVRELMLEWLRDS